MPQYDRRRALEVPIEYEANETLINLPVPNRIVLVLITDGKTNLFLNGRFMTVSAPSVLCLSERDTLEVIQNSGLFAQSFRLSPPYLKNRASFRQIKSNGSPEQPDALYLFFNRDEDFNGILNLNPQAHLRVFEWMCVIGTEMNAQSDSQWTCRVRAYFMMILNLLDEIHEDKKSPCFQPDDSPVDSVLAYIHTHYMEQLSLEQMCKSANLNRTSLSQKFKRKTGQSIIEYLTDYRLRTAAELLAHTGLTINEIARQTGFGYDTYLIRRFTEKAGMTPTQYRRDSRTKNHIVVTKE